MLEKLNQRISSGDLVATGYQVGVGVERGQIPPDVWMELEKDWDHNSASLDGLAFVLIRIARPERSCAEADLDDQPEKRPAGRPTLMPALEKEMRRRAAQRELAPTVTDECRHLVEWGKHQYPGRPIPKVKSIRDKLAPVYRQLEAEKSADTIRPTKKG